MNRAIGLAFLVGGIIILGYGINASHSVASGVSKAFTGQPTDHSMIFIVTGGVLAALGLGGLVLRPRG